MSLPSLTHSISKPWPLILAGWLYLTLSSLSIYSKNFCWPCVSSSWFAHLSRRSFMSLLALTLFSPPLFGLTRLYRFWLVYIPFCQFQWDFIRQPQCFCTDSPAQVVGGLIFLLDYYWLKFTSIAYVCRPLRQLQIGDNSKGSSRGQEEKLSKMLTQST